MDVLVWSLLRSTKQLQLWLGLPLFLFLQIDWNTSYLGDMQCHQLHNPLEVVDSLDQEIGPSDNASDPNVKPFSLRWYMLENIYFQPFMIIDSPKISSELYFIITLYSICCFIACTILGWYCIAFCCLYLLESPFRFSSFWSFRSRSGYCFILNL